MPYLREEVEFLMARRRRRTSARRRLAATHPELCCALTSDFCADAVRDAQGRLLSAKAAQVHGIEASPDEAVRATLEKMIAQEEEPLAPFAGGRGGGSRRCQRAASQIRSRSPTELTGSG